MSARIHARDVVQQQFQQVAKRHASTSQTDSSSWGPEYSQDWGGSSSSSSSRVPRPPPGSPPKGLRKGRSTPDPQQQPIGARYPEQQEEEEQQGDQNLLSSAPLPWPSSATSSSPSAAGVGSRSRRGLVAELERLSQKRERNIISEQEFKAAKTRLLLDASSQGQEERGSKRKIEGGGNNDANSKEGAKDGAKDGASI